MTGKCPKCDAVSNNHFAHVMKSRKEPCLFSNFSAISVGRCSI